VAFELLFFVAYTANSMITNGPYFSATMAALRLMPDQAVATTDNATNITGAIMQAYGTTAEGNIEVNRTPKPVTGLLHGLIQSGKTRAMMSAAAMAFDNGFRIVVVMTSNINDPVWQTHIEITRTLPGLVTFTKDNELVRDVDITRMHLEIGEGRLLFICPKEAKSLAAISDFLQQVRAEHHPAILFDNEGDQASLDTKTSRRTRPGVAVAPSAINKIIQNRLRRVVPRHVYVSVAGTPQAVLLQSADPAHRPAFIQMLPPGNSYVGGNRFFDAQEPETSEDLIVLVDQNEQRELLSSGRAIPAGLRESILFFLVSAAAAIKNKGVPANWYSHLCDAGLKSKEQERVEKKISAFLTSVYGALLVRGQGQDPIIRDLKSALAKLAATPGAATPSYEDIAGTLAQYLPTRRILILDEHVEREGIAYGRGLNFLICGDMPGRGIAIADLLVTYYVRDARISQADTMHQHTRMYGYRISTLPHVRLFIPRHLYYRFRDIHHADEELRSFIEQRRAELPAAFPVETTFDLRTSRAGVLDIGNMDSLRPGMHLFPNHIKIPQAHQAYKAVVELLFLHTGSPNTNLDEIERWAEPGVPITTAQAIALIADIKTGSRNTWRDGTIAVVIRKVSKHFENRMILRFRRAERPVREEGFISTETLSGEELKAARDAEVPTLWIIGARTTEGSAVGAGQEFMYPIFVIPARFPSLILFNRGQ
jgi:hypothetical protein